MIRAICGRLGSGKTLRMVAIAMEMMKRGRTCVSNTKIEFEYKGKKYNNVYCENADQFEKEIMTRRNAVVAIDEAGSIFSALQWNKLSFVMTYRFRVNRKLSCDLIYTAQDFFDTVRPLRKLTDDVVLCYSKPFMGFFSRLPRLVKGRITWDVPARLFCYQYCNKEGFTGNGLKRRNFYEFVWRRETFYPRHYVPVWSAYDTMDIPDPYVMIKKRSYFSRTKESKQTTLSPSAQRTGQIKANSRLLERAEQTLHKAEQDLENGDSDLSLPN